MQEIYLFPPPISHTTSTEGSSSSQTEESNYEAPELILCSIKAKNGKNFTWTNTMHSDGMM